MNQERIPRLKTNCILTPRRQEDGYRISVMSRHTLKDGKTQDKRIVKGINFDDWMPYLAPPLKLVGDYYLRNLPWEKFEDRYIDFLQNKYQRHEIDNLIFLASIMSVSILCIEEKPDHCHRKLLATECQRTRPDLILTVR